MDATCVIAFCAVLIALNILNGRIQRRQADQMKEALLRIHEDNRALIDAFLTSRGHAPVFRERPKPYPAETWYDTKRDNSEITGEG